MVGEARGSNNACRRDRGAAEIVGSAQRVKQSDHMTTGGRGAVAAGHPATAATALEVLAAGGNAVDAAVAGLAVACVAEPVLASLGGGGFCLVQPASGAAEVFDFFTDTPLASPSDAADCQPVLADFGTATQEFHIGLGTVATPGLPAGMAALHAAHGRLPFADLLRPAAELARHGVVVEPMQAFLLGVVEPIYVFHDDGRRLYGSKRDPGRVLRAGETYRNPELAEAFDAFGREGAALFYSGAIGGDVAAMARDGCALGRGDLRGYQVRRRAPLGVPYGMAEVLTNPPPSTGGLLIAFGLRLLDDAGRAERAAAPVDWLAALVAAMAASNEARLESGLSDDPEAAAARLLDYALIEVYRAQVQGRPRARRGTTHISVIDADGGAAALTVSNGEGCGRTIPGTGIMLNNMLGEEDLNPAGIGTWRCGVRMSSMMAPSLIRAADGARTVLGSGGSNRIRTALLQTIARLVDLEPSLANAVAAPRLHLEAGRLSLEPGFAASAVAAARRHPAVETVEQWEAPNLFFGGVHAVRAGPAVGAFEAAGDPRRGGVAGVLRA